MKQAFNRAMQQTCGVSLIVWAWDAKPAFKIAVLLLGGFAWLWVSNVLVDGKDEP